MRILLTGGTGQLGTEIKRLMPEVISPSRRELDLTHPNFPLEVPDMVIHAAAYTNVNKAEEEKKECWAVNVTGTRRLAFLGVPILYVSTDGVFDGEQGGYRETDVPNPKNFYSLTKLLGEQVIRNGVIARCCPKTRPWAHDVASTDRWFSAEYVDQTAAKIVRIARAMADGEDLPRIIHVGGERRTHLEMARETRPDVRGIEIREYAVPRGRDLSLDSSVYKEIFG